MAFYYYDPAPPRYANPTDVYYKVGARCRTCSWVYDTDRYDDVRFCPDHSLENDSEHARLGRLAVMLQDHFAGYCERLRLEWWWPAADSYTRRCQGSNSQKQWWKWVCQFHLMCERSLVQLGRPLLEVMRGQQHRELGLEITKLRALRFYPGPLFGVQHCAFIIITRNGAYVFDPTGVQFGPDWALVSRLEDYYDRRLKVSKYPSKTWDIAKL